MYVALCDYVEEQWGMEYAEEIWKKICQIVDSDTESIEKLYKSYERILTAP